jgi:hypothetical protein
MHPNARMNATIPRNTNAVCTRTFPIGETQLHRITRIHDEHNAQPNTNSVSATKINCRKQAYRKPNRTQVLINGVVSRGRRNTGLQFIRWSSKSQRLSWPGIES